MRKEKAITLISLVITIVILIILASVAIYLSLGNNGIFTRAKEAKEVTNKQTATEIINLKITTAQMNKYAEEQRMPTLKELSLTLETDNEIQYVTEKSQIASTKYEVGENPTSIYTKLNKYPYEFEINTSLQLASVNGVKLATNETPSGTAPNSQNTMSYEEHFTEEYWLDGRKIYEITKKFTTNSNAGSYATGIVIDGIDNVIFDETKSYILCDNRYHNNINMYWNENTYFDCWWDKINFELGYNMGDRYINSEVIVTIRYTKISEKQNID